MARKSFKAEAAASVYDKFFSEPEDTQDTKNIEDTQGYYRLNLKLKAEYKEYLVLASWEAHKSITQYINELIKADKEKGKRR